MGLIEVKTYTSAAEMMAAHAATRKRLLYGGPIKRTLSIPARIIPLPEVSRQDLAAHDERILGFIHDITRKPLMAEFIAEMSAKMGYNARQIKGDCREKKLTLARHKIVWMVCRKYQKKALTEIGKAFGGKDHTSIIHARKRIDALIASNDPSVADLKGWVSE